MRRLSTRATTATRFRVGRHPRSIGDLPVAPKGGGGGGGDKKTKAESYLDALSKQLNKAKELPLTRRRSTRSSRPAGQGHGDGEGSDPDPCSPDRRRQGAGQVRRPSPPRPRSSASPRDQAGRGTEQSAQSLVEGNSELKNQIGLTGKNAEEQARLEQARIAETIAQKEQLLAAREIEGAYQRELDAIRSTISSLKELPDLIGQKGVAEKLADDAKKVDEFAQQLGASFESAFEKAITEGGKLSDVLSGLAQDVAKLWLRQNVTGPLGSRCSAARLVLVGRAVAAALKLALRCRLRCWRVVRRLQGVRRPGQQRQGLHRG